jgi:thioredoxin reductase (NADPH)
MRESDVAIIGCGPAGLSAAIQLKRMGVETLIFEAARVGGLLANAHLVENYPGFPDGISGPDLVSLMKEQLERHDPEVILEEVRRVKWQPDGGEGFHIVAESLEVACSILLVASGTKARIPEGLTIPANVSDRVCTEIYPIRDIRGKQILIVGSGDAAFDYALSLAPANRVTVVNRSDQVKCLPLLWGRASKLDSIGYCELTTPIRLEGLGGGCVGVECTSPQGKHVFETDYVLLAVGREPRLDFVSEDIQAAMDSLRRNGLLHLLGDVGRGNMRQTAIAVGDGVRAAIEAHSKLLELRG